MKLTLEEYLLACLAEECAEVIQRVTKAQRFGLEEVQASNPEEKRNNRQRIGYELNDLQTLCRMVEGLHPDYRANPQQRSEKRQKFFKYMAYSEERGILDPPKAEVVMEMINRSIQPDFFPEGACLRPEKAAALVATFPPPVTDDDFATELDLLGLCIVEEEKVRGQRTFCLDRCQIVERISLAARDYSSALREAWNLYRD